MYFIVFLHRYIEPRPAGSTHGSKFFYHRLMRLEADAAVAELYRTDWGRILATVIRLVGDFEIAEEAAQEAFTAGVNQWRTSGVPEFPWAWIIQTARHKAIDMIRRRASFDKKVEQFLAPLMTEAVEPEYDTGEIPDDRLRLIFTC